MKFPKKLLAATSLVFGLWGLTFGAVAARAHDSSVLNGKWNDLKFLKPGQEIRVVTNDLDSYRGEIESVSDEGITLRPKKRELTIDRKKIFRISQKLEESHRTRDALLGAAIGAGAGLATGLLANKVIRDRRTCTEGPEFSCAPPPFTHWGATLTPAGAGLGGTMGAVLSSGGWIDIYRTR
jgi:hypothetical protein